MKLILSGLIAALLIFSACEKVDDQVVSPNEIQKDNLATTGSTDLVPNEVTFAIIPLPEKSPIYLDSIFTVSKLIYGIFGGVITLNETYISKDGKLVTMLIDMLIPPLSFTGKKLITLTIDDSLAIMHCEPGMNFSIPINVTQTFTGLNLETVNPDDIDYAYITYNGTYESVPNDGIIVIKPLGVLTVLNAKITHFSRYGWVRKHNNSN